MTRLRLETDLRQAVLTGGLELHYQPIISLVSGACSAFEALVRWPHPEQGMILPANFIPMAEESLLIIALDRWVMRAACRQLKFWQETIPGAQDLKVNVNLSGKDFAQPDLIDQVIATLRETGVSPHCLRLEITESAIMENIELANHTLRQLQALGVQVDIDDFGTGFSSLTYLFQLPVNTLKIDRSFVQQLGIDPRKTEIVRTILNLAHNIGLDVVAEGVETSEQAEHLRRIGCDEGQGYLFAPPLEASQVERYLVEQGRNRV
jgi:EAL domain-containing protein (putative c-di-GMP-specific phosphodiesterase class I)